MSFTKTYASQTLIPATDEHCKARWSAGKPGENFRCGFCGYKFKVGDNFRWIYTNDIPGAGGNPLVCEKCNDTNDVCRARWVEKSKEWQSIIKDPKWWSFYEDPREVERMMMR